MITPEEIIHTVERSHQAIKRLIAKGQKVERGTYGMGSKGEYCISVFRIEMSSNKEMKVVFNGLRIWDMLVLSDATKEQIEEFKRISVDIWNTLHDAYEEQNSIEYKFAELKKDIKHILNPMDPWIGASGGVMQFGAERDAK